MQSLRVFETIVFFLFLEQIYIKCVRRLQFYFFRKLHTLFVWFYLLYLDFKLLIQKIEINPKISAV